MTCMNAEQILEQRKETNRILANARRRNKKPICKLDTKSARYIVREKKNGTRNSVIARNVGACVRHVQRIWEMFRDVKPGDSVHAKKAEQGAQSHTPECRLHSVIANAMDTIARSANDLYGYLRDAGVENPNACRISGRTIRTTMLKEGYMPQPRGHNVTKITG